MDLHTWSRSNVDYGRKILHSGLEGARSGEEAFLQGRPLTSVLDESARKALPLAAIGACLGLLGSCAGNHNKSARRAFAYGIFGGVIGFGTGVAWGNRRLIASFASGARKNIAQVRDEHWLERNPIDYA